MRLRILSLLTGADLTAADVARELGLTHANASYHLRFLLDAGEIVVSGEETIRGGRRPRYRHPWRGEDRPPSAASADPGPPASSGRGRDARAAAPLTASAGAATRSPSRTPSSGSTPEDLRSVQGPLDAASWPCYDGALPPRTEGSELVNLTAVRVRDGAGR